MKELTQTEYQRCCLKVHQWRAIKSLRDSRLEDRYLKRNLDHKHQYGKWPLPPLGGVETTEGAVHVMAAKRRRGYGLPDRVMGFLTIQIAIDSLGYGRDFEAFLMRFNGGSPNTDGQCYKGNRNFPRLLELFDHLLRLQV